MIPQNGSFVKVCFTNGLVESGTVSVWNDNVIVLETMDSCIVINNPKDIFIYKIYKDKKEYVPPISDVYVDKELVPTEYVRDPDLRAMNIYKLKKELEKEEKIRAREKLTEFRPSGHGINTNYGNIDILRDKSVLRNTAKED